MAYTIRAAVANERLAPGEHVGFVREGDKEIVGRSREPIGIVDPFLPGPVFKGDRFWLLLYPYTITSLRHEWTHPAFSEKRAPSKETAEEWMREFADRADLSYRVVMDAAREFIDTGEHYVQRDRESARDAFWSSEEDFWRNYEILTGAVVPPDKRGSVFCCSC